MIAIVHLGVSGPIVFEGTAEAIADTMHGHILTALRGGVHNATYSITVPAMGEAIQVPPEK